MTSTCTNVAHTPITRTHTPFLKRFARGLSVNRTRHSLKGLDDCRLEDIGISRTQADDEARRPFWDVPEYWLR